MYAVVKAGGKQHKVAVGDVVEVNRLEGDAGDTVSLPALLVLDGHSVISETAALAKIVVTGEIVGHHKGPKIKILKYKNKTGYRKRIGHRQLLTELLVTDIDDGKPKKKAASKTAKANADEKPSKAAKAAPKAESHKAESAKAEPDDKPTKAAAETAKPTTTAKAATKSAPAKATAKKTAAKTVATGTDADDKPGKATNTAKVAKTSTAKTSKTTDEKKD